METTRVHEELAVASVSLTLVLDTLMSRDAVWNSAAYEQNKFLRQHGVIAQLTVHSLRQPCTLSSRNLSPSS